MSELLGDVVEFVLTIAAVVSMLAGAYILAVMAYRLFSQGSLMGVL